MKPNTFLIYLLIINVLGYAIMLYDKSMARNRMPRVPEKSLICIAAFGGSVGCLLAMYTIRHKTRHKKFKYGVPAILVVQLLAIFYYFFR